MEIKAMDIRKGIIGLIIAIAFGAMFYSCSSQLGIAQQPKGKNKLVKPIIKDSVKPIETIQDVRAGNKELQRTLTPLQKQLQEDLPEVLTRSKKAFSEITDIKSMLDYMNANSIAERDMFLSQYIGLKSLNDSLRYEQRESKSSINKLIDIAVSEKQARIANEKRTADAMSLNIANNQAQNLYTSILFGLLIVSLIVLLFIRLDIHRIKTKYNHIIQNG